MWVLARFKVGDGCQRAGDGNEVNVAPAGKERCDIEILAARSGSRDNVVAINGQVGEGQVELLEEAGCVRRGAVINYDVVRLEP